MSALDDATTALTTSKDALDTAVAAFVPDENTDAAVAAMGAASTSMDAAATLLTGQETAPVTDAPPTGSVPSLGPATDTTESAAASGAVNSPVDEVPVVTDAPPAPSA